MEIGVGLDVTLGLSLDQQAEMSREAARLGYTSIWTPEGNGYDSFHLCLQRWSASRDVLSGGVQTGIAVSPVAWRTPMAFAMAAGTLTELTGGRFMLGLGAGGQTAGILATMREYVTGVRSLLAGEKVVGSRLAIQPPPRTPVYLGALGPEMLRLAGETADGAALNWCSPEQIAWSRARIAEGAARAGRTPEAVRVVEYIRICVDDNVDLARRAYARALIPYALGSRVPTARERGLGYRAHFERVGFAEALAELDRMRERGATNDEIADAFPPELLLRVGYFGRAAGAREAFRRLAEGLDLAIVRVVVARPGVADSTLAVVRACAPS